MKYLLDASVAVQWVLVEPDSGKARRLRADFQNAVIDLIAPDHYVVEAAHGRPRRNTDW